CPPMPSPVPWPGGTGMARRQDVSGHAFSHSGRAPTRPESH
ncbi:MAG: hypothetical protein AVDCRST_MAG70-1356, partial [uncultured Thermomicrobiales bacterium]